MSRLRNLSKLIIKINKRGGLKMGNFIDKTFTVIADILLKIISSQHSKMIFVSGIFPKYRTINLPESVDFNFDPHS